MQASGDFPTIDSAIAEIKRLKQRIEAIEAGYKKDLGATRQKIEQRYAQQLAALDAEQKDEFESSASFKARIEKQRIDLQTKRREELSRLNVEQLAEGETAPLKANMQALAERRYTIGSEAILVELGPYDADKLRFSVSIRPRPNAKGQQVFPLPIAVGGTLSLPPEEARQFKQHWSAGLVRAEVTASADGGLQAVGVANDYDRSRWVYQNSEFLTDTQMRKRELARQTEQLEPTWRPEMISIPSGRFEMGSSEDQNEQPIRTVSVSSFLMAKTEVTQSQWEAVIGDNPSPVGSCQGCLLSGQPRSYFSHRVGPCGDCPVENVSWDDIQQYLQKLNARTGKNYRLPSEAEWEYACRGAKGHSWCGSNAAESVAWVISNSRGLSQPVAQKSANAFGLYDMSQ